MLPRTQDKNQLVIAYQISRTPWPDGIGAWYRPQDWDKEGNLIATGNDRARALDPWANDRAKGRPCPPIPGLIDETQVESQSQSVTEISVTEIQEEPVTEITVTETRVGRPAKADALTPAERMRRYRASKTTEQSS